ncbi:MAG TPA: TonB-dependent receptor [Steroidobacteraceae bacterium]|nr:TonB-dependent receptor [Steroidobacteraceae bacterium]
MKNSVCTLMFAGAVAAALNPGMGHAQSPAAGASAKVEEIIVTAQRRSERLQDVPVAVTAVKADQLSALGVESALDLNVAAPSLNTTTSNGIFTASIRGVGSFNFAPGVESPVALYVDGVYLAAPLASELTLNNVESVEVLKGPQGTLFGRNATGGLIQIATSTPTAEPEGKFVAGYGNYDTFTGNAYVSGGITDSLAADLAVAGKTQGKGFGRDIVTGTKTGRVKHDVAVRSKVVWTPGSDTTVTLIGNYWDGKDSQGTVVAFPDKFSGFVPGRLNPDLGYDSDSDLDFRKSAWTAGGALKIDHDFSAVRFSSISAYRKGVYTLVEDLDFTPFDVAKLYDKQRDQQFSQEFQLSSIGDSPLKWTTGLFYFHLKSGFVPIVVDLINFPFAGAAIDLTTDQSANSGAVYGQGSYEIFENTNLTLGARYTKERRREISPAQITTIPFLGLTVPEDFESRNDTNSKITYRVSLDHRFSDEVMGYVSWNTGFKSGGFNANSPGTAPYKPETLQAYETGLKTDLFDGRLRLNTAGFYYDYKNIQVQRIDRFALAIQNGPSARIYGFDADFTAVLGDAFSFTGGVNWISPKFKGFPDCPVSSPAGGVPLGISTCNDNQIPFAAKFTASIAANYSTVLRGGKLRASVNAYYNDGYFFESDNVLRQPSYTKLGTTATWTSDRGFSFGLFGKNLTDKQTRAFAATQASGNAVVSYDDPRTYGVTLGYEF